MRIGITCYPTYGGSGVVATELGMFLTKRGHEIHFISSDLPFRLRSFRGKFFFHEVKVINYPLFEYQQSYALNLAAKMSEVITYQELDILHVHYAIPHSISAYLARQITKRPFKIVTTLHGTDITVVGNEPEFLPVTQFGINESDGVTAVSNYLSEQTYKTFDINIDIKVIYNFVNTQEFSRKTNSELRKKYAPDGEKIMIHISNFRPVKRVDSIIEIFAKICEDIPSKLLLIGDGPERGKAEKMCRDLDICDHTLFLGKQTDIQDFLSISDLVICTSKTESFGLTILEAMSCGVPVLSTRVGGIPEIVENEKQGFLLDGLDIDEFALAGKTILSDKKLQDEMSKSGMKRARDKFDAKKIIPQYEKYYKEVLDR